MADAGAAVFFQVLMALFHAGLTVSCLAILRVVKSWPIVFILALGFAILHLALIAVGFLFMGWEQASKFILPSGELFSIHTLPLIVSTILTQLIVTSAAYAFFVEPGNRKNV